MATSTRPTGDIMHQWVQIGWDETARGTSLSCPTMIGASEPRSRRGRLESRAELRVEVVSPGNECLLVPKQSIS